MPFNGTIYPDWPQYIANISFRFGEVYSDPLVKLISIKQSGKVQEYLDAFKVALT